MLGNSDKVITGRVPILLVSAIWLVVVGGNVLRVLTMSSDIFGDAPQLPWVIILLPLVVVFGAYRMRGLPGESVLGPVVDRWFGSGVYAAFIRKLRPELMFSCMCAGIVLSGLLRALFSAAPVLPRTILGLFASGAAAFLIAHIIRLRRTV